MLGYPWEGWPIRPVEYLDHDEMMVGNVTEPGGPPNVILMHPTMANALAITMMQEGRKVSDPSVMVEASLLWQQDVIERNARDAEARLDLLVLRQDQRRAQRAADDLMRRKLALTTRWTHKGRKHRWIRDRLRRTARCHVCGLSITEEMALRLGEDLGECPEPLVPLIVSQMVEEAVERAYRSSQRWLDLLEDDTELDGETVTFPMRREDGAR